MMETLVVVSQHRNQYYSKIRAHGPARFGSFGSPPSGGGFRDINCRTFQSGTGILPTPLKACATAVTKQPCSPKTPSSSVNTHLSDEVKHLEKNAKRSSIPIPINIKADPNKGGYFSDEWAYSELWAGPAYSNSPPPSSLPMPKFSVRPKRTVSLDLPSPSAPDINFFPIAKSAPPSPTRDYNNPFSRNLHDCDHSVTKTLRRILNLDTTDE